MRRAASVPGRLGVRMLTVHAAGGGRMVEEAVTGRREGAAAAGTAAPVVLAVTVLTSISDEDLEAVAQPPAEQQVPRLARLAIAAARAILAEVET